MKVRPVLNKHDIEELLQSHSEYRNCLFARGYLITDNLNVNENEYPFYGNWTKTTFQDYAVLVHKWETFFSLPLGDKTILLIGHAYNPVNMKHDEIELLKDCSSCIGADSFFEEINNWTGVFALFIIDHQTHGIQYLTDAACMKMANYVSYRGNYYVSSHVQLLADVLDLPMTEYAAGIRKTRVYNTGMRWLPGDTTAYEHIHRLGTNLFAEYSNQHTIVKRFYPRKPHADIANQEQFENYTEEIAQLMQNNLRLCMKKWRRPAISLTGGMDSGCTFACSAGITNEFNIFSFDCKEQEGIDSEAARTICKNVGVSHHNYYIPRSNAQVRDYDVLCKLIDHNTAYVMNLAEAEIRKIIVLYRLNEFDVEIKSDVAEIGRVFYERKYGMPMPEVFQARHMAILQTRFFLLPRLQRKTEREYQAYLTKTGIETPSYNYEHSDLIYWEYRSAVAAASSTQSMGMAHTLTFPYNNRSILEKFLSFPHDMRMEDYPQKRIMEKWMPQMLSSDTRVEDKYFGKWRVLIEKLFFKFKTAL